MAHYFCPVTYKLSEIGSLSSGLYLTDKGSPGASVFYLQAAHFGEFGQFDPLVQPKAVQDFRTEKHLLRQNDILFAAKGLSNFAIAFDEASIPGKAVASTSFIVIRLDKENKLALLPQYLAWYLSNAPQVKGLHKQLGTTVPSISISSLKDLEVPVPPLETQKQIVAIQALRNREKLLVRQILSKKDAYLINQLLRAANQ